MNNQFNNHNYDRKHEAYLRHKIKQASPELLEKAKDYDWSDDTIASMV